MKERIEEGLIKGAIDAIPVIKAEKILAQMKSSICKIIGNEIGTGFFCKFLYKNEQIPVLMTNYHVIDDYFINNNKQMSIYINEKLKIIDLNKNSKIYSSNNKEYDLMIIKLKDIEKNITLEIDNNIFIDNSEASFKNHSIYVLHYPNGGKPSISFGYGLERLNNYDIKHLCNTNHGSSGGPILSLLTNKIIGIHKGCIRDNKNNNKYNIGTFLRFPLSKISDYKMNKNLNLINNNNIENRGMKKIKNLNSIKKESDNNLNIIKINNKNNNNILNQNKFNFINNNFRFNNINNNNSFNNSKLNKSLKKNNHSNNNSYYRHRSISLNKSKDKDSTNSFNNQFLVTEKIDKRSESNQKKVKTIQIFKKVCANGLQNIGAINNMNPTLQCFAHVEILVKYLLEKKNEIKRNKDKNKLTNAFLELIENIWDNNSKKEYAPFNFKNLICEMNPLFRGLIYNDVKDLILFLIETMNEELNKVQNMQHFDNAETNNYMENLNSYLIYLKNNYQSIIFDNFYGVYNFKTTCSNCGNIYYSNDNFNFLIFPLERIRKFKNKILNNITIKDCFEYYESPKNLTGDNKYFCNKCNGLKNGVYVCNLVMVPKILIIILNRGKGTKLNVKIDFDENIDTNTFNLNNKCINKNYKLIGIVTNYDLHFIAFCKSFVDNNWYKYNDSIVSPSTFNEAKKSGEHNILFYYSNNK